MRKYQILIVEDEPVTRTTLASYLQAQGYTVFEAASAPEAEDLLPSEEIDLLIVDINLEGKDGLEITREQRARSDLGIILLTGRSDDVDRIVGLELGADDYVCKPFNRRELLARIKNLLRRTSDIRRLSRRVVRFGDFTFDSASRRLQDGDGETVPLTRAEFELLNTLIGRAREVLSRDMLMGSVTHRQFGTNPRTVDVLIRRLRAKIEEDPAAPRFITTVHGEGYVFTAPLE
ncbi:response regulator [Primorskyibacter flagellatus]|uniref:Regulatory protein VirG n=1 Tax=Primorskyibacter flagellatus TaxID=1387277 RepID=A0A1W2AV01_9RHOB|nr:response regulator [Primorskyibacter flagellatus]SMC64444.1 two-component system, OmpR family, torCAD operon response regulator TorR [Primorskyibacter flagellatus]